MEIIQGNSEKTGTIWKAEAYYSTGKGRAAFVSGEELTKGGKNTDKITLAVYVTQSWITGGRKVGELKPSAILTPRKEGKKKIGDRRVKGKVPAYSLWLSQSKTEEGECLRKA